MSKPDTYRENVNKTVREYQLMSHHEWSAAMLGAIGLPEDAMVEEFVLTLKGGELPRVKLLGHALELPDPSTFEAAPGEPILAGTIELSLYVLGVRIPRWLRRRLWRGVIEAELVEHVPVHATVAWCAPSGRQRIVLNSGLPLPWIVNGESRLYRWEVS